MIKYSYRIVEVKGLTLPYLVYRKSYKAKDEIMIASFLLERLAKEFIGR